MKIKTIFVILISAVMCMSICACEENITYSNGIEVISRRDIKDKQSLNFSLSWGFGRNGGYNGVSTYTKRICKDLIDDPNVSVDFIFPEEIMQETIKMFLECKIDELPEVIEGGGEIKPTFVSKLIYSYKGKISSVYSQNSKVGEYAVNYNKFTDFIIRYVYATEEYKSLPPARGGYL